MYLISSTVTVTNMFCAPRPVNCAGNDLIDDFRLNGELGTYINDTGTGCATNSYDNRTQESVSLWANKSYTAMVSTLYGSSDYLSIWIDFNDNCVFEASEMVSNRTSIFTTDTAVIIVIRAVSQGAAAGTHRMRAVISYSLSPDPCSSSNTYGETHDYTVVIYASPGKLF